MLTRTDIERRYLPPGSRLNEAQWRYVQAFIALDDLLESAGTAFGKSFLRSVLLRYLSDRDPDADRAEGLDPDGAPSPSAVCSRCGRTGLPAYPLRAVYLDEHEGGRIEHVHCPPPLPFTVDPTDSDPTPPHGIPRPHSRGRSLVLAEAQRLDAAAGRSAETTPDRVARLTRAALDPRHDDVDI